MSKARRPMAAPVAPRAAAPPAPDPASFGAIKRPMEALARFRHDGRDLRIGDVIETTASDAADLVALGFARPKA